MSRVFLERFSDVKILSYNLPGFEQLSPRQRIYIYHLSEAALCGRDILFDQNYVLNLRIRRILEDVYQTYSGDAKQPIYREFLVYLKQIWFANGIHHHYSMEKIKPNFSEEDFKQLIAQSVIRDKKPAELINAIFNDDIAPKRVSLDSDIDLLKSSAMNYYQDMLQEEAEQFYEKKRKEHAENTPSFGLNSTLIKDNGKLVEQVWQVGGKYTQAIEQIVQHLENAIAYAENKKQEDIIKLLINYYQTGKLETFDDYSKAWVDENEGEVDFINGFIEVYGDPLGIKGSWEAIVNYKDNEASERANILSTNAAWFESNSPVNDNFKKNEVKGVSAKVINVAMLGGDCYPATPIGINLPNSEWVREQFGSKSVTIENITQAYFIDSLGNGMLNEFAHSNLEIERATQHGQLASNLHTDLHECLGHGSGRMMPGVKPEDLKNYYSTIEETRADLFALYYITDKKLIDLKLVPSEETGKSEYDAYIRNGLLTQLTRIELGKDLEESHMRNRQLIAKWAYEKGKAERVIELLKKEGKTYVLINDYKKLRALFAQLLTEIQRIKSEGDYQAAKNLVESYGVKVDKELHSEILQRFRTLNVAPYAGFVNPVLEPILDSNGLIIDVKIGEKESFEKQMIRYSNTYSFL